MNFNEIQNYLLNLLVSSKDNLSNRYYDYLLSIINLDFSAVRDEITSDERKELLNFDIYKKAIFFNLYFRELMLAKKLFDRNLDILEIHDSDLDFKLRILDINYKKEKYIAALPLFKLMHDKKDVPTVLIGNLMYDKDATLEHIEKELKLLLFQEKNANSDEFYIIGNVRKTRIEQFTEMRKKLKNSGVSDYQRDKMRVVNKHINAIKEDYALDDQAFNDGAYVLKKMPGLIIKQKIQKY